MYNIILQRVQGEVSEAFRVQSGQLFNLTLEKLLRTASHENNGVHIRINHQFLGYADDIVLRSNPEDIIKQELRELSSIFDKIRESTNRIQKLNNQYFMK